MNVKFKMPKFGRVLTGKGFLKELGLTILATTISIILTFGTAHLIEQRQKKHAGRQTAMMVIHDIDENVQLMRDLAKNEVENFELSQYIMNHLDSINAMSFDTLNTVFNFISQSEDFKLQDSKEKIFHSSQDSWKNIDNAQFIDVVQTFFYERRYYQDYFNNDYHFQRPLSREKQYEIHLAHAPSYNIYEFLPALIKEYLPTNEVQFYLMFSPTRSRVYNSIADSWKQKSDQCKFIMGITDEEMAEYIKTKDRSGKPAKKGDIVGKWVGLSSEDTNEEVEFMSDNTFKHITTMKTVNPFYSGRLFSYTTLTGTWEIEGDSLIRHYNKDISIKFDRSQMTCQPEMKDSVDSYIANSERIARESWRKESNNPELSRFSMATYVDESGDKLEMTQTKTDAQGKETVTVVYMTKVREK